MMGSCESLPVVYVFMITIDHGRVTAYHWCIDLMWHTQQEIIQTFDSGDQRIGKDTSAIHYLWHITNKSDVANFIYIIIYFEISSIIMALLVGIKNIFHSVGSCIWYIFILIIWRPISFECTQQFVSSQFCPKSSQLMETPYRILLYPGTHITEDFLFCRISDSMEKNIFALMPVLPKWLLHFLHATAAVMLCYVQNFVTVWTHFLSTILKLKLLGMWLW